MVRTDRISIYVVMLVLFTGVANAKHVRAPLPREILSNRTIYIDNQTGDADTGDRAYDMLRKWTPSYTLVSRDQAALVFVLTQETHKNVSDIYSATMPPTRFDRAIRTDTKVKSETEGTVTLTITDQTGRLLFQNTKPYDDGVRDLLNDLKRRIIEEVRR